MKENTSLMAFDSQAQVLEETRAQRQKLMKNLADFKKQVKAMVKEVTDSEFKELGANKKRRLDMLVNLTKLNLQIVDQELKIINSSVDSEVAYKSLMVEVLKLKEELMKGEKERLTFAERNKKPKVRVR